MKTKELSKKFLINLILSTTIVGIVTTFLNFIFKYDIGITFMIINIIILSIGFTVKDYMESRK